MTRATCLAILVVLSSGDRRLAGQPAPAATRLTLVEAVERALHHHPSVGAARFAVSGARAAASGATAARWPSIGLTASGVRYQEPMPVTPIHGFAPNLAPPFDRTALQGGVSLRYTLFDGSVRPARIGAARAESEAAEATLDRSAQGLAARVAGSYLDVLSRAGVLAAQDRRIRALEAELGRVRQLLVVGRAAEVDLLRVEAALAAAEAEAVSLRSSLETAELSLSRLTGVPVDSARVTLLTPLALTDTVVPVRETLLRESATANLAVVQAQRQVAAVEARAQVARGARWPRLDLAANYLSWASVNHDPTAEWNAGLFLSWPVFTGGAVRHEVRRADAELAAARERRRLAETDAEEELDRALAAARAARARMASLAAAVARSDEVVRIERLRLETGAGVQADYLDAEAVRFANEAARIQARYGEILAWIDLARVTGRLDLAWLGRALGEAR